MKNPHFFYTHLILASIRPLVNRWSPVTNASHCMTTSRPAAATQMRVRVSQAMHRDIFTLMPLLLKPSLFPAFGTGPEYAGLHTLNFKTYMKNPYMTSIQNHTLQLGARRVSLCVEAKELTSSLITVLPNYTSQHDKITRDNESNTGI